MEVLGTYLGDDGVKIKDLPEMTLKRGKVDFDKVLSLSRQKSTARPRLTA